MGIYATQAQEFIFLERNKLIKDSRKPKKNTVSKSDLILKAMAAEKGVIIK